MIVPWLQVAEEAFERAVELAAVLKKGEAQALGHLVWLWRWALSRPADTELTGIVSGATAEAQIEAGARWKGRPGDLVAALRSLGLVVDEVGTENNASRVCGLDRYREMLEARRQARVRKEKWKESRAAGTRSEREPDAEERGQNAEVQRQSQTQIESQTQTQTQSQIEKKKRSTSSTVQPLRAEVPAEDKNAWVQEGDRFVAWAKTQAPTLADPGPMVTDWARQFFVKHQPADVELPRAMFCKFLVWCHQAGKQVGWGLWLSPSVHEPRWAEVRAEAQARGAA